MSTSEFEGQLNSDGDAISPLHKQEHPIPADFGEEDLAFAEELNALFSPRDEELPPYFVQTLLEFEDPRYYPVEPGFEKKTSVRVFRNLKLRRRLYHDPRSLLGAVTTGMRGISARRSLLALTATLMFIMVITVAFTAPSFAQGVAILLQGARGGIYQVPKYPSVVHRPLHSHQHGSNAQPGPIPLLAAQQRLHFSMYWPAWYPRNYSLDSIYLYQAKDQSWSDGPLVELVFSLPDTGAPPKGTGEIVIREFKPSEEALQVVQDNAWHTIQNDQYGHPDAIYVNGQWLPSRKSSTPWAFGGRSEVIYGQDGVVFWIAGDQRDGIGQMELWQIAQSMQTKLPFSHQAQLQITVQQAALSDARDVFENDTLAVFPDGSPESAYFMSLSSFLQQQVTTQKSMSHGN
ncbi:MAG TPA: hypothetical protein VKB35_20850 [Ktedonobacteraceae bacterium]|nr:hypothetical protein [Ktedonobacteraceae bacterium]